MFKSEPIENPVFSAWLRLGRAHEQLDDLEAKIDRFFAEKPNINLTELDPDGIHIIHKVHIREYFPANWCLLATEIVEHLRAALDHAVYATRTKDPTRHAAFPCARIATDLDNRMRGFSKDTPPEIQSLLRSFNCHEGGNDVLYFLNELCNASKHGLIMLIAGATLSGEISGTGASWAGGVQFFDPLTWDGEKNEIRYARTKRGVEFEHQGKIRIYVALKDAEGVSPIAATAVLDAMLRECERVVSAIEVEGNRIGAFS
jgi:hypothetical protein